MTDSMKTSTPTRRQIVGGAAALIAAPSVLRIIPANAQTKALKIGFVSPASGPLAIAVAGETRARLSLALARLPEEQRVAFLLYVEGGFSVAEIAEQTGAGAETAKSRLRYAVARLKEALGSDAPVD